MPFCQKCGEPTQTGTCQCGGLGLDSVTSGLSAKDNVGSNYSNAYLSSGLNVGVEKGLKKMMGLGDSAVNEVCVDCGRKIIEEVELFVGPDNKHVFCRNCYANHYKKGDCSHCRKPVLGLGKEYVTQEGKVWHRECFTTTTGGKGCHVCSEVILGDACEALGHYYHPLCFACVNCAQPVSGPFVDHNGEVCCKPCYERIKQARPNYIASAQPLVANQPSLINHQQQQKHLQQNLPQSSNDCYKCGTAIINISGSPDNGMVLSTGKHLHVRCFNCADCGNPITDGKFMAVGDNNYHPTCRASVTVTKFGGKQLLCNGCQNPITSSYMKHEDSFYHSECFRCTLCKKSIGSEGYLEDKNGLAICEACYSNGQTNKPTSIPGIGKPIYKAGLKQSGAGADTKLGMAPLGGTLSSGVATVGGKNVCPLCKKQAYPQEQVPGPQATVWHRACLRCTGCKKQLDSNGHVKNGRPYCIACEKNA